MNQLIEEVATISINSNNQNCLYHAPALAMPFDTSNPNQHQDINEAYARWLWENIKLRDTDVVDLDKLRLRYNLKLIEGYQIQMSCEVWQDLIRLLKIYVDNKQNISITGCQIASLKILSCLNWLAIPKKLTFDWLNEKCTRMKIPFNKCHKGYEIAGKHAKNLKLAYQTGILNYGNNNADY